LSLTRCIRMDRTQYGAQWKEARDGPSSRQAERSASQSEHHRNDLKKSPPILNVTANTTNPPPAPIPTVHIIYGCASSSTMPKSAIDATRFTPTTPHASAKPPPPSPSSLPHRTPGPPGETPQQKVRRLREAAARARDAKVSGFDKFIIRGRVWADRAHRFTALSLIGITGTSPSSPLPIRLVSISPFSRTKHRPSKPNANNPTPKQPSRAS
jgi:Cytochrome oxidase c assembly